MGTGHTWLRLAGALAVAGALAASAAWAEEDVAAEPAEGSTATRDWGCTWLPALRCGRSGRPEGWRMPIVQPYRSRTRSSTGIYPYVYHDYPSNPVFEGGHARSWRCRRGWRSPTGSPSSRRRTATSGTTRT
jgi:hypothetical protein